MFENCTTKLQFKFDMGKGDNDRTIVILKIVNEGEAVKFDGKYYERQGTRTVEVENEAQMWKRFF